LEDGRREVGRSGGRHIELRRVTRFFALPLPLSRSNGSWFSIWNNAGRHGGGFRIE
jgi:hypothetical protein